MQLKECLDTVLKATSFLTPTNLAQAAKNQKRTFTVMWKTEHYTPKGT